MFIPIIIETWYKVFIIPGSRTIHWSSLKKIKEFYDNGGKVIATTRLPESSAEFGKDNEVKETIAAMFGAAGEKNADYPRVTASSAWAGGGFDPENATDGDPKTRWNAADGDKNPQWLEVDFGTMITFGKTVVREAFDRTRAYRIQAWDGTKWNDCAKGERLGVEKTDAFAPVNASKVRLWIDAVVSDSASISEFGVVDSGGSNLVHSGDSFTSHTNSKGGKAYFIRSPQAAALKAVLDDALKVYDVAFEQDVPVHNGNLSYIHKVVEGRDVYFFGNSSDNKIDTFVRIRGKHDLEAWNPHTGAVTPLECESVKEKDKPTFTRIRLKLELVHSIFVVEKTKGK